MGKKYEAENSFERSLNRITDRVAEKLTDTDWKELAKAEDSVIFHFSLGLYIRNTYRLWEAKWVYDWHPDDVSDMIVKKLMVIAKEKGYR